MTAPCAACAGSRRLWMRIDETRCSGGPVAFLFTITSSDIGPRSWPSVYGSVWRCPKGPLIIIVEAANNSRMATGNHCAVRLSTHSRHPGQFVTTPHARHPLALGQNTLQPLDLRPLRHAQTTANETAAF